MSSSVVKHRNAPLVVLVTCPTAASAKRIASAVVRRRLAACVNALPGIDSTFWWQGQVDRCREVLLIMKTTRAAFPSLQRTVVQQHPYDVPEVVALPIVAGSQPYLRWVADSVESRARDA